MSFRFSKKNHFVSDSNGEAMVPKGHNLKQLQVWKKKGMSVTFCACEFWYWTAMSPFQNHHDPDPRRCRATWNIKSSPWVRRTASRPKIGVCLSEYMGHLTWIFSQYFCLRLASGIGSGNSSAKHARAIGDLFASQVFNKILLCI